MRYKKMKLVKWLVMLLVLLMFVSVGSAACQKTSYTSTYPTCYKALPTNEYGFLTPSSYQDFAYEPMCKTSPVMSACTKNAACNLKTGCTKNDCASCKGKDKNCPKCTNCSNCANSTNCTNCTSFSKCPTYKTCHNCKNDTIVVDTTGKNQTVQNCSNKTCDSCNNTTATKTVNPTSAKAIHPSAHFTAAPIKGSAPLTVKFIDKSTGTPTKWLWSFGDLSTSTKQNPSHVYKKAGKYTVKLQVWNSAGTCSEKFVNYVIVL